LLEFEDDAKKSSMKLSKKKAKAEAWTFEAKAEAI